MLTHKDKKYIKKNIQVKSLSIIARELNIEEDGILRYLENIWTEDKYKKYIQKNSVPETKFSILDIKFSFREWLTSNYNWAYIVSLFFLVALAYFNSLNNAFLSDDIFGIVDRRTEIGKIDYILSRLQFFHQALHFFIAYRLGGLTPWVFRLPVILYHSGNVAVIFILVSIIASLPIAFFTAAIFAVHPILVESVAWISGGTFNIYSFYFLLALLLYITSAHSKLKYVLSVISYTLSMTIGVPAIGLSPIFFLVELFFGDIRRRWKRLIPYFMLSAFFVIQPFLNIQKRSQAFQTQYYQSENYYNPFLQIPVAITSYFQLIFWPDKLTLYHSELSFPIVNYLIRLGLFILFIGFSILFFKKNKLIFLHVAIFLLSLAPTLTPVAIAWVVAERYVYLGTYAIIFITVYYLLRFAAKKKFEPIIYSLLVLAICALTIRTIARNIDWKSEDNLWIATAKTSPSDPKTHNNLGDVYARHGNYQKSIESFQKAIELNPRYGDAYNNLGNVYYNMGDLDQAQSNYQKALQINPNIWQTQQNLGIIYSIRKDHSTAIKYMKRSIELAPYNPTLYVNLGLIYLESNNKEEARKVFTKTLELDPTNEQAKEALRVFFK